MDPKHGITEGELDGLSEAERAALEGDDGEGPAPDAEDPPEDATKAPVVEGEAVADAATDTVTDRDEPFAVPFHHESAVKGEEAKARMDSLQKRFDDGEIDLPTFLGERDGIMAVVIRDRVATDISEKSKEQMAEALWKRAIDNFMDDHDGYRKDPVLHRALDAQIKVLAGDPANDQLSDKQLLAKAHQDISSRFKVEDSAPAVADPKKALAEKRRPNLKDVPRTIGSVPAAAENVTADDEFADLDKLAERDSALFEQKLAKMTAEQQDRYLRGVAA
jgi:hypothetical protein